MEMCKGNGKPRTVRIIVRLSPYLNKPIMASKAGSIPLCMVVALETRIRVPYINQVAA